MNLLDAYVTKILSEPNFNSDYARQGVTWWEIMVEYDSYGVKDSRTLSFDTKEKAEAVKVGYHFLT
jgi:hypothetical protein